MVIENEYTAFKCRKVIDGNGKWARLNTHPSMRSKHVEGRAVLHEELSLVWRGGYFGTGSTWIARIVIGRA